MSLTPEHDKRGTPPIEYDGRLHPDVSAAYDYVENVVQTADGMHGHTPTWHGWALREAFLAGISYAERRK